MKAAVLFALAVAVLAAEGAGKDRDVATCEHNGVVYNAGDRFKDDCNFCACGKDGEVRCTKKACDDDKVATCEHNGVVYNAGDRFKDDCNFCGCGKDGEVRCTKKACRDE